MTQAKCTFLGKGAKGKGLFDVYIDGKVIKDKTRKEADELLEKAKGSPVTTPKSKAGSVTNPAE